MVILLYLGAGLGAACTADPQSGCEHDYDCAGDRVCEDRRCVEPRDEMPDASIDLSIDRGSDASVACETDDDCPLPDVCIENWCVPPCDFDDCERDQVCAERPDPGYAKICQDAYSCEPPTFESDANSCGWTWTCDEGSFTVACDLTDPEYDVYECHCAPGGVVQAEPMHGTDAPEICSEGGVSELWNFALHDCGWLLPRPQHQ